MYIIEAYCACKDGYYTTFLYCSSAKVEQQQKEYEVKMEQIVMSEMMERVSSLCTTAVRGMIGELC